MKACGLVVEYNPFHYGHLHHLTKSKELANADCIIAVMSGNFLQRGEPAVVDKIHRAKAALQAGADIVLELPYAYTVQYSSHFATGAIRSLHEFGASSICFGSESGEIQPFQDASEKIAKHHVAYKAYIDDFLKEGMNFPSASAKASEQLGITALDVTKPNNILGLSYVQAIAEHNYSMTPLTIKRIKNDYHDQTIASNIASATSIRQEFLAEGMTSRVQSTIPEATFHALESYYATSSVYHEWEAYFPLLQYQILASSPAALKKIHGVDEGLENRAKRFTKQAVSFQHWIELMKTKRYTVTRLQRMAVHILTQTTKEEINAFYNSSSVPYVRLLGLTQTGRSYFNKQKKEMDVPVYTSLNRKNQHALALDEKVSSIYYQIIPQQGREHLRQAEFNLPLLL